MENTLGIRLGNIPHINIRLDFNALLALFRNETFRKQFSGYKGKRIPVKSHYFTWHGQPNVLLTYLLRDSIVGLECAVSAAVWRESHDRDMVTEQILQAVKNPFILQCRGSADCVYNKLPALIEESYALNNQQPVLWEEIKSFYKDIRNPIFHASEISDDNPEPVWNALELLWKVYQWLNGWHPISKLTEGPIRFSESALNRIREIPIIKEERINQILPKRDLPQKDRQNRDYLSKNMTYLGILEVLGLYISSEDLVDISMKDEEGNDINIEMPPYAAIRLLGFLALARNDRGWEIPDRL